MADPEQDSTFSNLLRGNTDLRWLQINNNGNSLPGRPEDDGNLRLATILLQPNPDANGPPPRLDFNVPWVQYPGPSNGQPPGGASVDASSPGRPSDSTFRLTPLLDPNPGRSGYRLQVGGQPSPYAASVEQTRGGPTPIDAYSRESFDANGTLPLGGGVNLSGDVSGQREQQQGRRRTNQVSVTPGVVLDLDPHTRFNGGYDLKTSDRDGRIIGTSSVGGSHDFGDGQSATVGWEKTNGRPGQVTGEYKNGNWSAGGTFADGRLTQGRLAYKTPFLGGSAGPEFMYDPATGEMRLMYIWKR